jgi:hypothetical protein
MISNIYVVYMLLFCTSYNLYKIFMQVITCVTPSYKNSWNIAESGVKTPKIKSIYEAPFALDGNDMTESLSREPHMVFRSPTQLHIRESDHGREVI